MEKHRFFSFPFSLVSFLNNSVEVTHLRMNAGGQAQELRSESLAPVLTLLVTARATLGKYFISPSIGRPSREQQGVCQTRAVGLRDRKSHGL